MKPPDPILFRTADFPKDGWVEKFLTPLNRLITQVTSTLKNLTLAENHVCSFKTIPLTFTGTSADDITFEHGLSVKPTGCVVFNALATDSGRGRLMGTVTGKWLNNGDGTVTVQEMSGLTASSSYNLTFLVFGEPI